MRRQRHAARVGAVVDHAEQAEKLRIRAVALVHRVRVQDRARLGQRGSRDHEAVRLEEAEPFEVGAGIGVGFGQVVNPAGCRRRGFPSEAALRVRR